MLKNGRIAAALLAAACIFALAARAEPARPPESTAPFADAKRSAEDDGEIRAASARGALDAGLPALAQMIVEDSRKAGDSQPAGREMDLIYVDSMIAQGEFDKALRNMLPILEASPTPENRIRAALAHIGLGDADGAEDLLEPLSDGEVPKAFEGWHRLALGYIAYQRADVAKAVEEFERAKESAVGGGMLADVEIALNIARLAGNLGRGDLEKMEGELADNVKIYMGTPQGFQFAKQYAAVLFKLGKFDEAVEAIEQQLQIELSEEIDRDELRLIGALIARNSARQFAILRDVLKKTSSPGVAEYAIALLGKNPEIRQEDFDSLIDDILKNGSPKIRDKILLEKAKICVKRGDAGGAEEFARRLAAEFPGSGYRRDALRILAWAAYSRAEGRAPEYRLAAAHLSELSELESNPRQARLIKLLAADCYRLSSDFQSAAAIYRPLIGQFPERAGAILFKAVDAMLEAGDEAGALRILDESAELPSVSDDDIWNAEWLLAQRLRNSGRSGEALGRIDRLLKAGKPDGLRGRLLWLKAVILRENADYGSAEKICSEILSVKNLSPEVAASAMLVRASCLESLDRTGGENGAFAVYERLRREYPSTDAAQISYINQARAEAAAGRYAEARRLCVALTEKYPKSPFAYSALFDAARYAVKVGLDASYKDALAILDRLCAAYPDDPRNFYARLEQADVLKLLNSFADARALYNEILNKYPSHPEVRLAWLGLGDATLAQNSRTLEAAAIFERLYSLPNMPPAARAEAAFKWSFALERAGKSNEANEVRWLTSSELLKSPVREPGEGYWIGRSLYNLARFMESENRMRDARAVYEIIVKNSLPPLQLARQKLGLPKEK